MKLRDIPKVILSKSPNPLSAKEIWAEAKGQKTNCKGCMPQERTQLMHH